MKRMKKLASLVLAMVMAFALAAPAFAADVALNVKGTDEGHEFIVYQVFTGDPADNNTTLTNVKWGGDLNGKEDAFVTALSDNATLAPYFENLPEDYTAGDVATAMSNARAALGDKAAGDAITTAAQTVLSSGGVTLNSSKTGGTFATGYYIIKDTLKTTGAADEVKWYANQLTEDTTITPKNENAPTMTKQVESANGSGTWQDAADYNVGDDVSFKITATLPGNFASLKDYRLTFKDTQGLGFGVPEKVTVTYTGKDADGKDASGTMYLTSDYTYTLTNATETAGYSFELEIANAKADGSPLKNLVSGEVVITYTAELLKGAVVGGDGNKNNVEMDYTGAGEPIKDVVTVFTFDYNVNKVIGGTTTPLPGAAFTLERLNGEKWETVKAYESDPESPDYDGTLTSFTFEGLKAGRYRLVETKAPDTYNKLEDPIYFAIVPTYNTIGDPQALTGLKIVMQTEDGATKQDSAGKDMTVAGTVADGSITATVENFQGAQLPETGGIGTTIFYILGGILVVGAAVLLITKRRMNASEE